MAIRRGIRAFSNPKYDYYELTKSIGGNYLGRAAEILPAGSIFVHDTDDHEQGSITEGCLKLCWNPDGNCYGMLCANTVVLHAAFKDSDMFKIVRRGQKSKICELKDKIAKFENDLVELKDKLDELILKGGG